MRIIALWRYLAIMTSEILRGCLRVAGSAWLGHPASPSIIEMPLRCRSDVETSLFTASIAIPPGTIVLGIAAGRGDDSATIFVHSVYDSDRHHVLEELTELEDRVIALVGARR